MEEQAKRGDVDLQRTCKDSVFCDMFSQPKYLLGLYRELHPEDADATEGDLEVVSIDRVITTGMYNDLGFTARGHLLVLVEAQSTFSPNIATRMLFYLVETYRRILDSRRASAIYGTKAVALPSPELYVVYTGERKVPAQVDFARDILGDPDALLQFRVDVITGGGGIVGQYFRFSRRFDECRKSPEPAADKVPRLLEDCISCGILSEYLRSRYKEVHSIMVSLFSQEEITQDRIDCAVEEAVEKAVGKATAEGHAEGHAEGLAEGLAEGKSEGILEGIARTVKYLMGSQNIDANAAMSMAGIAPSDRTKVFELVQAS